MTITISQIIDPDKAVADVTINETGGHIDPAEFTRQPGLVYYYTACVAKAEKQLSTIKLRREMAEAEAQIEAREALVATGEKFTVDQVKAEARKNRKVTELDAAEIKAQEVLKTIQGVVNALHHKKDMLVMRGHMTRDEIKARITVEDSLPDGLSSRQQRAKELLASRAEA